jgi:hypothetical protein
MNVDDFDLLVKSIREDGFTLPVIVNSGATNPALKDMIIDGEHRWRAAMVLGMPEIPIIYKDMDEAGMRVSTLRHNEARGQHDPLMEAALLEDLTKMAGADVVMDGLNMDSVELDSALEKAGDYTSMADVANLSMEDNLAEMAGRNVTGQDAEIIAGRHSVMDAKNVLKDQEGVKSAAETGQNLRLELVYSGSEAATVKHAIALFPNVLEAVMTICKNKVMPKL